MISLMKIVGIDPSLTATGIAVIEDGEWLGFDVLTNKLRGHERMDYILGKLMEILWNLKEDDVVVIEGQSYGSHGQRSHELGGLWWLIRHEMWELNVKVVVVPPTSRAKYAAGKGNAGKQEVLDAVTRRYPSVEIVDHNQADAMILAAMAARHYGMPMDVFEIGSPELDALTKIEWADGVQGS